ncbi:MAG: DUF2029 domain-containing protein [Henriciella sp.]|nr:DUF2029 domain-containing protein [Henriciella sp.]
MSRGLSISHTGLILAVLLIGLAGLSLGFPYGAAVADMPLGAYISIALIAGAVWAALPFILGREVSKRPAMLTIFLIGLLMRGAMFVSLPVLEDDSYRYLWDGAVTARGLDPYAHAPAAVSPNTQLSATAEAPSGSDLAVLQTLAIQHETPHSRINYPYVSTIYPPLAQAAFAVAHVIDPFGLTGWRLVLLAADLATMGLLLLLLRAHGRDSVWASVYWWNPVVILQGFGAGHMDLLLLPFLMATLLFAKQNKISMATVALAGATAIKLWPAILFPLIARPLLRRPTALIGGSVLFAAIVFFALLPQLIHALRPEAGLNAYASEWRTHTFIFAILEDFVFAPFADPGGLARVTVAGLIILLTSALALFYADNSDLMPALFAGVVSALILLSPTGYPWYLIWLAPLLAFVPNLGLVSLFVLAPLYWMRFQLGDDSTLYQWLVVPAAFGVPLLLLAQSTLNWRRDDAFRHHYPSPQ